MNTKTFKNTGLSLGLGLLLLASCSQNDTAQEAETNLEDHIARVEAKAESKLEEDRDWVRENWNEVEREYNEMKNEIEDDEIVRNFDTRWNTVTTTVESWEPQEKARYSSLVMSAYHALGISDAEASMNFVTKDNILSKYRAFVNAVDANKKSYDTNDWADIEVVWDALNKRKNELEPLKTSDNLEIAQLKTEFAGIKTVRKTEAKIEDKLDNKQYND